MGYSLMVRAIGTKETGSWRTETPVVAQEKCNFCGLCLDYCPDGVIGDENGPPRVLKIDLTFCKGCGICAEVCKRGAISMVGEF